MFQGWLFILDLGRRLRFVKEEEGEEEGLEFRVGEDLDQEYGTEEVEEVSSQSVIMSVELLVLLLMDLFKVSLVVLVPLLDTWIGAVKVEVV